MQRMRRTGDIAVALPLHDALRLFTPDGERKWVDHWAPRYVEDQVDDTAPGTVFTTDAGGMVTIWVVIDRRTDGYRYVRVAPGYSAGTVTISGTATGNDTSIVTVSYDLSALSAVGGDFLTAMAGGFAGFLAGWESAIVELLI